TTLAQVQVENDGISNAVQNISVNATGGTFVLTYLDGLVTETTGPLAFDAPAIDVENALKALPGIAALLTAPGATLRVSGNGSVYQAQFAKTTGTISLIGANGSGLKPLVPGDLVGFT